MSSVINKSKFNSMFTVLPTGITVSGETKRYPTYADMLADPNPPKICVVTDATADPTVQQGSAIYVNDNGRLVKWYETESMDQQGGSALSVNWENIVDKPQATTADIDQSVIKSHFHENKNILDGISATENNRLKFNNNELADAVENSQAHAALQLTIANLNNDKVDRVAGKSLLADTEIIRLAGLTNYDDSNIQADITNLQSDVQVLYGALSGLWKWRGVVATEAALDQLPETELVHGYVYQVEENNKEFAYYKPTASDPGEWIELGSILTVDLSEYDTSAQVTDKISTHDTAIDAHANLLNAKVDKVNGSSLVADTEIARLSTVSNYNDSALTARVSSCMTLIAQGGMTTVVDGTNTSAYIPVLSGGMQYIFNQPMEVISIGSVINTPAESEIIFSCGARVTGSETLPADIDIPPEVMQFKNVNTPISSGGRYVLSFKNATMIVGELEVRS